MVYHEDYLGTAEELNDLEQVLKHFGIGRFPRLLRGLQFFLLGRLSRIRAAAAVEDLTCLRTLPTLGRNAYLVNAADGEAVLSHTFRWPGLGQRPVGDLMFGVDGEGGYVRDPAGRDQFRSSHFLQEPLEGAEVELVALDTGVRFRCPQAVVRRPVRGGADYVAGRAELYARAEDIRREPFDDVLHRLEVAFRAAVATGNRVEWSWV